MQISTKKEGPCNKEEPEETLADAEIEVRRFRVSPESQKALFTECLECLNDIVEHQAMIQTRPVTLKEISCTFKTPSRSYNFSLHVNEELGFSRIAISYSDKNKVPTTFGWRRSRFGVFPEVVFFERQVGRLEVKFERPTTGDRSDPLAQRISEALLSLASFAKQQTGSCLWGVKPKDESGSQ